MDYIMDYSEDEVMSMTERECIIGSVLFIIGMISGYAHGFGEGRRGQRPMTDETLNRIRTAVNAEIEELHCNSGEHSYDVQVNAIMIVEGLRRALRIVEEEISLMKDGDNGKTD